MFGPDFLKKAQEMQDKMAQVQADLAHQTVTGSAGGRLVTVTMTGANEMRSIHLDPDLLKNEGQEIIEDLIVAATNDALVKAQILAARLLGGIEGLPPGISGTSVH